MRFKKILILVCALLAISLMASAECGRRPVYTYCVPVTQAPVCGYTQAPVAQPTQVPTQNPTQKPTQKPTAIPDNGQSSSSLASGVVAQVNAERIKYGLSELTVDGDLTRAACVRAKEIVENFAHTRPDGSGWSTVSGKAYGENIAKGYTTVDKVMAAWMSSEGHRANILRESFGSIGVCVYEVNGVMYWVQLFGH